MAQSQTSSSSYVDNHHAQPSSLASSSASPPNDFFHAGFIYTRIVDVRSGNLKASGDHYVRLVRDPRNPRDPNAIKVLKTRTQLAVGHVERSAAAVLSPLIDCGLITVEGIIFTSKLPTPEPDTGILRCHVFTSPDLVEIVPSFIQEGGFNFLSRTDRHFARKEAGLLKLRNRTQGICNLDQLFALGFADEIGGNKRKIVEPPKDVISSELLMHQKEGLAWLIQRENSCDLPPFWDSRDAGLYVNVLTNSQTMERPEPLQGGIFADDMGLGKTLTMLSLIAANGPGSVVLPFNEIDCDIVEDRLACSHKKRKIDGVNDDTVQDGAEKVQNNEEEITTRDRKKSRTSCKRGAGSPEIRKTNEDSGDSGPKTTLIVCPNTVLSTWVSQIKEHTRPGFLKVYKYYGARTTDVEDLRTYDIVLTTYKTLSAEKGFQESPIKKIEWWRIILDEAHMISNVNSDCSKAVIGLNSKRRWAVTGTPMKNGLFDLFSYMSFLRFEPFSIKSNWQSLVQSPINQGKADGLSLLQALMRRISLRRTKYLQIGSQSLVELPPITIETCFIELSAEEREQYDLMESDARMVLDGFIHAYTVMENYSTITHSISLLRQICDCLELCPSDLRTLCPSSSLGDISSNPNLKNSYVLQDGDDVECVVCLSPPTEPIITSCAHIFCRYCILKALQRLNPCCPLCRNPLSQSNLFPAPTQSSYVENPTSAYVAASSKVSMLLKYLVSSQEESPCIKSVIFSDFEEMLILLEGPLKAAGFNFLRLDKSMNDKKRVQVIKQFDEFGPGSPTVLLASANDCSRMNLTSASRAYLFEPWLIPSAEEQAMDCLHQVGQKKAVKVMRLIVENSIEERILELLEGKKDLARMAFTREGSKELRQVRLNKEELATMLRL
ncbi:hypothetical protein AAC387_Pa03g1106 [Persea americana]